MSEGEAAGSCLDERKDGVWGAGREGARCMLAPEMPGLPWIRTCIELKEGLPSATELEQSSEGFERQFHTWVNSVYPWTQRRIQPYTLCFYPLISLLSGLK